MWNAAHPQGGAAKLAGGADAAWALPIGAAVLGVRHMGLGGWQPQECMAVENELSAWQRLGELSSRDNALRCRCPGACKVCCNPHVQHHCKSIYACQGAFDALMPCRLKATLERAQRMTQSFTDSLLEVLPSMADGLGNALGIEQERQRVRAVRCCMCHPCDLRLTGVRRRLHVMLAMSAPCLQTAAPFSLL